MILNRAFLMVAGLAACLLTFHSILLAQPPASTSAPTSRTTSGLAVSAVTAEAIQSRIQQLQEDSSMDAATRNKELDLYRQAIGQLRMAEEWRAKAAAFEKAAADAPAALAEVQATLQAPTTAPQAELPANATLQQVDQALAKVVGELGSARREVTELEQEAKSRSDRLATGISRQLESVQTLADDIKRQAAATPANEPADLTVARKTLLTAQDQLLVAQRMALYRERRSYQAQADLLNAQQEQASARFMQLQKRTLALRQMLDERRLGEAQLALRKAQEALQQVGAGCEPLTELARVNVELAQRRTGEEGTTAQIKKATDDLTRTLAELAALTKSFESISERAGAASASRSVYQMLRRQQASLPDLRQLRRQRGDNQARLEQLRQDQFDLDDLRKAWTDVESRTREIMLRLPEGRRRGELQRQVASLLKDRLVLIDALKADYDTYLTRIENLDSRQRRLMEETTKFSLFIDEHVLWLRSTTPLCVSDLPRAGAGLGWLGWPSNWTALNQRTMQDATSHWPVWMAALLPVILLVLLRRVIVRRLEALASDGRRSGAKAIRRSLEALALTALLTIPAPLLLLLAGGTLESSSPLSPFALAISGGLIGVAVVLLPLELLRQICRPRGLAQAHVFWPEQALHGVRRCLAGLVIVATPLVFLVAAGGSAGHEAGNLPTSLAMETGSLGRLAFLLLMLVLIAAGPALLRPFGKLLRGGRAYRLRHVLYALALVTPLLLACASAAGYHYTALHLWRRLLETMALVLALVLLRSLLWRWLRGAFRRFAADRIRAMAAADRSAADAAGSTAVSPLLGRRSKSDELRLSTVGSQSRRILRYATAMAVLIGGWFIWADVLPAALAVLRNVELWSHTVSVSESVIGRDGAATVAAVEKIVPVTLSDLLLAIGVVVLTVAASRNIPGLLEITLLRRLKWDFGSRYAFTTIVRYILVVVGAVMSCGLVGVTWSKIQWLIAAITVGLGFGLQEIFANFVSGLILLFERPMRVGDMVTVGEVTGTVTKIRIRATTIMDFDRKELVVPNKEFITGKLMNWTLSDTMLRAVIPVGVAYDADTKQVLDLLLQVAREHPDVIKNPPPECEFSNFGDSSLNFELRAFVKDWPTCKKVRNELQIAILHAFRRAGISIPFPQREIHVRNVTDSPESFKPATVIQEQKVQSIAVKKEPQN